MTKKRRTFTPKDLDALGNVETRTHEVPTTHEYDIVFKHPSHREVARIRRNMLQKQGGYNANEFIDFILKEVIEPRIVDVEAGERMQVTTEDLETAFFGGEARPVKDVFEAITELAKDMFSLPGEDYQGADEKDGGVSPN